MNISAYVKVLLTLSEKKISDLLGPLNMSSRQSLSNKFSNGRWSGQDLMIVAKFCDAKLAFVLPNGQLIIMEDKSDC